MRGYQITVTPVVRLQLQEACQRWRLPLPTYHEAQDSYQEFGCECFLTTYVIIMGATCQPPSGFIPVKYGGPGGRAIPRCRGGRPRLRRCAEFRSRMTSDSGSGNMARAKELLASFPGPRASKSGAWYMLSRA